MNYIKLNRITPTGTLKIDSFSEVPAFTKTFEEVEVTHFFRLDKDLIKNIGLQFLKGARITISTPAKKFFKTYQLNARLIKPFYIYKSVVLDKTEIPRSLAEFKNGSLYNQIIKGYINFNDLNEYSQTPNPAIWELNSVILIVWQYKVNSDDVTINFLL